MTSRSTNTMSEGLEGVLKDLASLMTTPDADLQFLANLQTAIIKKLREPDEALAQMQQQSMNPSPQTPGMSAPPTGVPGVMSSPNMAPAADELRRVINQ